MGETNAKNANNLSIVIEVKNRSRKLIGRFTGWSDLTQKSVAKSVFGGSNSPS